MIDSTWADVKAKRDLGLPMDWEDVLSHYVVRVFGASSAFECKISREPWASKIVGLDTTVEATNLTDFETNYKDKTNTALSMIMEPFAANTVEFKGEGVVAAPIAGNGIAQNIDLKMLENRLLNGGILFASGANQEDWFKAQVVDKDAVIPSGPARDPYPDYPILNEWIPKWGVIPGFPMDLQTPQAGTIPALTWIRIIVTPKDDSVARLYTINYRLSKKL